MNSIINKVEEKTGMDLNNDNHVGNSGNTGHAGAGHSTTGGAGIVNKAEQLTHMDLNGDGRVGGGAPQHKH
ncbi:unnamed protein product [Adineta steineri]|uniref:Uncharacterized protein n=1 Tax=Adineta steineri TaxID=433720 RepID=A0A819KH15_9BILA|nr:unnamed protein product [Adineta steineri]CAF3944527.1 unnamed protein product [Adineta steineri]